MKKTALILIALLAGCDSGGVSTTDVRQAAIDKVRDEFGLPADAPVEARIWTGSEYDGEASICGTVSSANSQMPPQRFLARLEPFEWLLFENAHSPMRGGQKKFPSWQEHCSSVSGTVATTETPVCGARLDSNQNGTIEEAEYNSFSFAFDNWDTNEDLSVSQAEFQRCWGSAESAGAKPGVFATFDEDDDAKLSQEEFFAADKFREFAALAG